MKPRLTYANVASTVALVFALGGTGAYAAGQLAARSVGVRQLRPGAVTADKLRKNAVTAPKIKALAVKEGKVANGAITRSKLDARAVGSEELAAGVVTNEKLAADSVTGDKIVEATLGQVPSAAKADLAVGAESANPVAFAAVDLEGAVIPALSKGIFSVDVVRKAAGIYCVSSSGLIPRGAQVTPRNTGDGSVSAFVTIGGTEECPAPQAEVRTYNGVLTSEPFYVVLYR